MKKFTTVMFSCLFVVSVAASVSACKKDAENKATPVPATKAAEPAKADPAKADPAKIEPAAIPAAGAGSSMSVDQAGEMVMGVTAKMAAAVKAGGGDCAKIGAALVALKGETTKMMELGKAFDSDAAKKKEFDSKFGKKFEESMTPMFEDLGKCGDNADVKSFFESLESK